MNEVINIDKLGEWLKAHPEIESVTVDNPYHEKFKVSSGRVNLIWLPPLSAEDILKPRICQSKP